MSSSATDLKRILGTIGHAGAGVRQAISNEVALKQEVFVFLILIPLAFWWGNSALETVVLITTCLLVFSMELANCAIEAAVDRISLEKHELSGLAKDLAGAAVWVLWANLVITWTILGVERFL